MSILLVRHGETVWNVARRMQGHRDSPLTLRGIGQARANAALLAELLDDPAACRIVASPLARTWQTATILAEGLGRDPESIGFDDRLREQAFGQWEGLTPDEIARTYPDLWHAREADKWAFQVPGGESYAMVAARLRSWLDEQGDGSELLVVSHGLAGRVLRGLYAGLSEAEIMASHEPQGSVFRLTDGVIQEVAAGDGGSLRV